MAKRFFYVCAGLLCLAVAYHFGARSAGAQSSAPRTTARFTVVTGTGEGFLRAFLVDTATGETWHWQTMAWETEKGKQDLSYWHEDTRGTAEALRIAKALGAK